jgi:hypothetical protein
MHLCTCVSEECGDGQGADSEAPSLLSYTIRYVSLAELGTLCRVLSCHVSPDVRGRQPDVR